MVVIVYKRQTGRQTERERERVRKRKRGRIYVYPSNDLIHVHLMSPTCVHNLFQPEEPTVIYLRSLMSDSCSGEHAYITFLLSVLISSFHCFVAIGKK